MAFFKNWFDVIFLLFFFGLYIYLAIFKGSKALFKFLILCILWSTSEIWIVTIPNHERLFSDTSSFLLASIPFEGLIYGVPLTILTFITWHIKKRRENKRL